MSNKGPKLGGLIMRHLVGATGSYSTIRKMDVAFAKSVDSARKLNTFSSVLFLFAYNLHPLRFPQVCAILLRCLVTNYDSWRNCRLVPTMPSLSMQRYGWALAARLILERKKRPSNEENLSFASNWLVHRILQDPCLECVENETSEDSSSEEDEETDDEEKEEDTVVVEEEEVEEEKVKEDFEIKSDEDEWIQVLAVVASAEAAELPEECMNDEQFARQLANEERSNRAAKRQRLSDS